ncbi:MAG TPA: hypothetical protein VHU18_02040 [Rhizomicrobium sp.]|jgi:hypothetical protein|nr:hypothetical protein [Rhizomicrobium sp.]
MTPSSFAFRILAGTALILLGGCIGTSALSQMDRTRPIGGPFSQALFKNYAALAHSFGEVGTPTSGTPFDAAQSISLGSMSSDVADIANTYAQKALETAQGDEILPEDADSNVRDSYTVRVQLLRDLDQGRDKAPGEAARAQADYDCWVVNARSNALRRASQQCRRSLGFTLARLEQGLVAATPSLAGPSPAAGPSPVASMSAAPAASTAPATEMPAAPPPQIPAPPTGP